MCAAVCVQPDQDTKINLQTQAIYRAYM